MITSTATQLTTASCAGPQPSPDMPSLRTARQLGLATPHLDSPSLGQAFRRCGSEGLWLGRRSNETSLTGWTNYTPCFPTEVRKLLDKVNDDEYSQEKLEIAQNTRYLEIAGFSISFIALLLSLYIFSHFKSLRNSRTNIHRNLFAAMTIQVLIRLIMYTDQAIIRDQPNVNVHGLDDMPYLCEVSYILLEYAISSMFMWMFIEGLFLHSVVTANVLRERTSTTLFLVTGWGMPVLVTTLWAVLTAIHYNKDKVKGCWYGYNFLPEYWLLQGPRLAVILINLFFLLNIMRVLITKLNATENNEITKVKKAAKAALVLLPLLGITNILNMIEPVTGAVWKFAFWCYITHSLRSFQGFFIALIYCFLNGEVNEVIHKSYRDRIEERRDAERSKRNASGQRELHSRYKQYIARWWHHLLQAVLSPFRKARRRLRPQIPVQNSLHDPEMALDTVSEYVSVGQHKACLPESEASMQRRNYADPYFQNLMGEIRFDNDRAIVTPARETVQATKPPQSQLIKLTVINQTQRLNADQPMYAFDSKTTNANARKINSKQEDMDEISPFYSTDCKDCDPTEITDDITNRQYTYNNASNDAAYNNIHEENEVEYGSAKPAEIAKLEFETSSDDDFSILNDTRYIAFAKAYNNGVDEEFIRNDDVFDNMEDATELINSSNNTDSATGVDNNEVDESDYTDNTANDEDNAGPKFTTMNRLFEYYTNLSEDGSTSPSVRWVPRCTYWDDWVQDVVLHREDENLPAGCRLDGGTDGPEFSSQGAIIAPKTVPNTPHRMTRLRAKDPYNTC